MYELRERDFQGFFQVPFQIYPERSPSVSPMASDLKRMLDPDRNPFYRDHGEGTFFVLYRDGAPVGRVSAHVHHDANRRHDLRRGYFGFLDVEEDRGAVETLLGRAEAWIRKRGCTEIAGNFSLTSVQEIGVVTRGHDASPYTAMHWSPPYLPDLLEELGYQPFFPMTTYEVELEGLEASVLEGRRQLEMATSPVWTWTGLGRRAFRRRTEDVRRVLNESFANNPHYVPVSKEEFNFQAGPLQWIVDAKLSVLVDRGDEPAGVLACIPDLNPLLRSTGSRLRPSTPWHFVKQRRCRRAVVVFAGVVPGRANAGLGRAMLHRTIAALKKGGYTHLGITWVSPTNRPSLSLVEKLNARELHELSLYSKSLEA